jgi:hypothetical protein
MLTGSKWYFKPWALVVAILLVGPFALPLVWMNPGLKKGMKILISIMIAALTVWMVYASVEIVKTILKEIGDLEKVLR